MLHRWTQWIENCPSNLVSDGSYTDAIPSAVSVPTWAYLDVASGNGFSIEAAESAAAKNPADVTATGTVATATGKGTATSFTFSEPSYTFSEVSVSIPTVSIPTGESTTSFSKKKKVNVGAIVGGVVGGISALLSAIAGFWVRMKRKARKAAQLAATATPPSTSTPDPEKLNATSPSTVPTGHSTEYFPATLPVNPGPPPVLYVSCPSCTFCV